MATVKLRNIGVTVGLGLLVLLMLPFALYALQEGRVVFAGSGGSESRLFTPGALLSNYAIFGHMMLGGVLTLLVPLQALPVLRQKLPRVHRWSGRFLCGVALLTAAGGLTYIAARGTIGGMPMDVGFALYGVLLGLCAVQAVRRARARQFDAHRRWALRLLVLCLGSWLYRVHYGVWYALTGGLASTPTFEGTFDLIQNVAFYLPYLVLLELWMRRARPV